MNAGKAKEKKKKWYGWREWIEKSINRTWRSPTLLETKPFQFKDVKINLNVSSLEFPNLLYPLMFGNPQAIFISYILTVPCAHSLTHENSLPSWQPKSWAPGPDQPDSRQIHARFIIYCVKSYILNYLS